MHRLGLLALVVAFVAAALASSAGAALLFLFKPVAATPGDRVTIRSAPYTPVNFTLRQREKPFQKPIRLYLVRNDIADEVHSRLDPRLHFIGTLVPDRQFRGLLVITVPPLDTGDYGVAAWLLGDTRYGRRPTFLPPVGQQDASRLRVTMPSTDEGCPVTTPRSDQGWYGNGLLWTQLEPSGDLTVARRADGTLFQKLGWLPHKGLRGTLSVSGERLDARSPPLRVLNVFWGYGSSGPSARGSWATPVEFPSEGFWRLTGRVRDITLTYVVQVVASP